MVVYVFLSYTQVFAAEVTGKPGEYKYNEKAGVSNQIKEYLCAPTEADKTGGAGAANVAQGDLYTCINKLYKFAIVIGATIGVFFLVLGGYYYMGSDGNQESVDKAKDMLMSTITAMVILLAGYILLKAINPDLIQFKQIQPGSLIDLSKFSTETDFRLPSDTPIDVPGGVYTDASARAYLSQNGISVNKPAPATDLNGIKPGIIQEIVNLKKACNCTVIVTAGTESGHSTGTYSHTNGYKIDLGMNSTLDNYIKTNFTAIATRSDGAKQWKNTATGAIYAEEATQGTGPHWDVVLKADSLPGSTGTGGQTGQTFCQASATYNCNEPGTAATCNNYNSAFQQYASMTQLSNGASVLKAIAYHESRCRPEVSSGSSHGIMQMQIATANNFKSNCSITENIDVNWFKNNPTKSICLTAAYLSYLRTSACGSNLANILAGYSNGVAGACTANPSCNTQACSGDSGRNWHCTSSTAQARKAVPEFLKCASVF